MIESRRRSLAKVISWRVSATLTTTLVSYFLTGSLEVAAKIGLLEMIAKLFLHYYHERIWLKIKFGLSKPSDYAI